jgi:hypothetical protein
LSFLLDTNVISEWAKPLPSPKVIAWLAELDEDRAFISVLSFAEIARGVELLPQSRRRTRLAGWLENDLPARFEGRVIEIDLRIARAWGSVMARSQNLGLATGAMDGLIAATAATFDLTLATRNVKDFDGLGIRLFNPWSP